ncbi:MAG: hypothetical protein RLP44_01995 [Aggregatilineales bacterium]
MNNAEKSLISRFVMAGILLGAMSGLGVAWIVLFIMGIGDPSLSLMQSAFLATLCMVPVGVLPAITVGGSTGLLCALITRGLPRLVAQPIAYYFAMILTGTLAGVAMAIFWRTTTGDSLPSWIAVIILSGTITGGLLARGYLGLVGAEAQVRQQP